MAEEPKSGKEALRRAPTLYIIVAMKLLKGLTFVAVAYFAYILSDNDLPADFKHLLQILRANPEKRFWSELTARVGSLTEAGMVHAAVGTFIYSLFSLVEGVGLLFRISWAGWLSIGESAFFIPIEVWELVHMKKFTWTFFGSVFGILVANIFILWYLFQNRERLFKHHR